MKNQLEMRLIDMILLSRLNDEPLDGDDVDKLCQEIKYLINLHEGNITPEEWDKYFGNIYRNADNYILVTWPESQDFMEEDWFQDEAVLADEEKFGGSAYFIPQNRVL